MNFKILIPVLVVLFMYFYLFLGDIVKAKKTKIFPKYLWIAICCISIPIGGIIYYIWGKSEYEE